MEEAARVIRAGGVVLHPTDTVYGLACDPFQPRAVSRLIEIKGRDKEKGFLLLLPDLTWIEKLCSAVPAVFDGAAARFWPGPVTFLLRASPRLPILVRGREGKVGLRRPALPYLESWMRAIPGPIVSTSANPSGQWVVGSAATLSKRFQNGVDLVLEAGEMENPKPSTVVDLTTTPPGIVRRGREAKGVAQFLGALS